jgi:hypothetical protein
MKLWVQLDAENIVTRVAQYDGDTSDWLANNLGGAWMESPESGGPAVPEMGKQWHPDLSAFLWENPFDSWVYDAEAKDWRAPVDYPYDGTDYSWDETSGSWLPS